MIRRTLAHLLASSLLVVPLLAGCDEKKPDAAAPKPSATVAAAPAPAPTPAPTPSVAEPAPPPKKNVPCS
jgi:internalin A